MGRLEGKVALITGAARGQGRSHAVRFAQEGADVVAIDCCRDLPTIGYPMATPEDLAETVRLVEAEDRRILARQADVRDSAALRGIVAEAVADFGHLDTVVCNAGLANYTMTWEISDEEWDDVVDVNLTGVWKTMRAVLPHMLERKAGGSITLISSAAGLRGLLSLSHYCAAKHGLVGLARSSALELAPHRIRVNTVHPGTVDTPFVQNETTYRLFRPELPNPTREDFDEVAPTMHPMGIPYLEPGDISAALVFLASDEARYITGATLSVDAGMAVRW